MSNQTKYQFWKHFLTEGEITYSSVPKIVLNSTEFTSFYNGLPDGAIISVKNGRGRILKINGIKKPLIELYFKKTFPNSIENISSKADSVAMYRNSKASGKKEKSVFFLKCSTKVKLNGAYFELGEHTRCYGISAFIQPKLEFEKVCFVENKDVFLDIETLLGYDYLYVHKYGRIGRGDIGLFNTKEILVFSDYDYVGLNEYLVIKSEFSNTKFYVPDNFNELYAKYSMTIPEKQVPSDLVSKSTDEIVVKIRTFLQKENRFLEQQSLLINHLE